MAEAIVIGGQRMWLKQYARGNRAFSLGLLGAVARRLHLDILRPPPHRGGDAARDTEMRRLAELQAQQVNVPPVLGQGAALLILGENGRSLASCLREADPAACDALVAAALAALVRAHGNGAYFGQPLSRNMTWDGQAIGFLDFEEDPLEVMSLVQAQARDVLMLVRGVARHYLGRPAALQALLDAAMAGESPAVLDLVRETAGRLHWLEVSGRWLGRSGQELSLTVAACRRVVGRAR